MKSFFEGSQRALLLIGAIEVLLNLVFWTGHALALTQAALWGMGAFTLLLWTITVLCARAGAPRGMVITGLVTGAAAAALGWAQLTMLAEPLPWIVRAAHMLLAMVGMGVSVELAASADLRRLDWQQRKTPPVTTS